MMCGALMCTPLGKHWLHHILDEMFLLAGQRLCKADESHTGGRGTYTRNGYVYSSLAGHLQTAKTEHDGVSPNPYKPIILFNGAL